MRFALALSSFALSLAIAQSAVARPNYPKPRREQIAERRFGLTYSDPFRWMENLDDPELSQWTRAENAFTEQNLAGPVYDALYQEFTQIIAPTTPESMYERRFKRGLRKVLTTRRLPDLPDADFGADGVASELESSPGNLYDVVETSDAGADFNVLTIKEVATGNMLPDVLLTKGATIVWESDDSFLYATDRDGRLGESFPLIRRHKLRTKQNEDTVIFGAPKPSVWVDLFQLGDGRFVLSQSDVNGSSSYDFIDLATGALTPIVSASAGYFYPIGEHNGAMLFVDFRHDSSGKIASLDLATGAFTDVVGAQAQPIGSALVVGDQLFVEYLADTESVLTRVELTTRATRGVSLPTGGHVTLSSPNGNDLKISMSSYDKRRSYWRYDAPNNQFTLDVAAPTAPVAVDAQRITYTAHDGRQAAIWVIKKQGLQLTPETPVYLYGYGGFRINILPAYQTECAPWLKRGGVVAIVTLPGGMEYGEDWHTGGALLNKKNVYDDFAAAGQKLIDNGWTSADHLGISGASNGGLLAAATAVLYPNLFRAAVPEVGVLEFTKFQLFTSGKWWVDEYGDRNDRATFLHQYSLSPYAQLTNRRYPAMLVTTADSDDRVQPSHSYKFAARLQETQSDDRIALLHVRRGGSHFWSTGTVEEQAKARALKWSFLIRELGLATP